MSIAVPPVVFACFFLICLIETAFYYSFNRWYYRSGPKILRERWQTVASSRQVRELIRPVLDCGGLRGHESPDGFCIRQQTMSINAYPRVLLRIDESSEGAVLIYEVRPYYSLVLLPIPVAWSAMASFGGASWLVNVLFGLILCTFACYRWLMPYDVKRINRLRHIRQALVECGLRVCDSCGYDLFGQVSPRCPECGAPFDVVPRPGDRPG